MTGVPLEWDGVIFPDRARMIQYMEDHLTALAADIPVLAAGVLRGGQPEVLNESVVELGRLRLKIDALKAVGGHDV